jgi:hypothetical protein
LFSRDYTTMVLSFGMRFLTAVLASDSLENKEDIL